MEELHLIHKSSFPEYFSYILRSLIHHLFIFKREKRKSQSIRLSEINFFQFQILEILLNRNR